MSMRKVFSVAAAVAVASNSRADAVLLRRAEVVPNPTQQNGSSDGVDPAEIDLRIVPAKNPEASDVGAPESSDKPRKPKKNRKSKKDVPARPWWKTAAHALGTAAIGGGGYAWGKASCPDIPKPVPTDGVTSTGAPTYKPAFGEAGALYDTAQLNSTLYSKFGPGETPASAFGFNPELAPGEEAGCNQYDKTCKGVFTYNNYLNAFTTEFPTFKSEADAIATFGGGVANMMAETGDGQFCGENVQEPDGNGGFFCPTKDGNGCSAGKRPDYSLGQHKGPNAVGYGPIRAAMNPGPGFTQTTCNGKTHPTNGCVVWKGSPHEKTLTGEDANECFSGQGAFMTTWAYNFEQANKGLKAAGYTDIDLCEDPKAVCQDGKTANAVGMQYWKNKAMKFFATDKGLDFTNAVKKGIAPEDIRNIPKRVQDYKKILERYNVPFTVDGETVENYYGQEVRYENIIVQSGEATGTTTSAAATPSSAPSPAAVPDAARAAQRCYEKSSNCNSDHCPSGLNPVLVGEPGSECRCGQDWNDVVAQSGSDIHRCGTNWLQCSQEGHTAYGATPSAGHCRCGSDWSAANAGQVGCIYQRPSGEPGSGRRLRGAGLRGAESS